MCRIFIFYDEKVDRKGPRLYHFFFSLSWTSLTSSSSLPWSKYSPLLLLSDSISSLSTLPSILSLSIWSSLSLYSLSFSFKFHFHFLCEWLICSQRNYQQGLLFIGKIKESLMPYYSIIFKARLWFNFSKMIHEFS